MLVLPTLIEARPPIGNVITGEVCPKSAFANTGTPAIIPKKVPNPERSGGTSLYGLDLSMLAVDVECQLGHTLTH